MGIFPFLRTLRSYLPAHWAITRGHLKLSLSMIIPSSRFLGCIKCRLQDNREGRKMVTSLQVWWYFELWSVSSHLLVFTFQSPQIEAHMSYQDFITDFSEKQQFESVFSLSYSEFERISCLLKQLKCENSVFYVYLNFYHFFLA